MNYYKCGHIMTTHGLKGDLKIKNLSDFDRFKKGNKLYILHNDEYVEVTVYKSVSFKGDTLLVSFKDLLDINLVEKYHSDDIYVSDLEREDDNLDGEYYYSDLVGKKVVNQNKELRGTVLEIKELPQYDYLVVDYNGKNVLVPFIDEFIIEVNDDEIVVDEIEGLF
ncbi:MAG: 16S rRNA processing protein RimM [Acholeplasmatales bacterium]|nr:16S rRNA processing protein RimM [Acholeplasmatales bacterium]